MASNRSFSKAADQRRGVLCHTVIRALIWIAWGSFAPLQPDLAWLEEAATGF